MSVQKVFAVALFLGLAVAGFSMPFGASLLGLEDQKEEVVFRPNRDTAQDTYYFAVQITGVDGTDEYMRAFRLYTRGKLYSLATARGLKSKVLGNDKVREFAAIALGMEIERAGLVVDNPTFIVPVHFVAGDEEVVRSAGFDLRKIVGSGAERRNSIFLAATATMMDMNGDTVPFMGINPGTVHKSRVTGKDYQLGVVIPREVLKFLRIPQELSGGVREEVRHGALPKMLTQAIDEICLRIIDQLDPPRG